MQHVFGNDQVEMLLARERPADVLKVASLVVTNPALPAELMLLIDTLHATIVHEPPAAAMAAAVLPVVPAVPVVPAPGPRAMVRLGWFCFA